MELVLSVFPIPLHLQQHYHTSSAPPPLLSMPFIYKETKRQRRGSGTPALTPTTSVAVGEQAPSITRQHPCLSCTHTGMPEESFVIHLQWGEVKEVVMPNDEVQSRDYDEDNDDKDKVACSHGNQQYSVMVFWCHEGKNLLKFLRWCDYDFLCRT
ncbi:hypothetical protein E2C01_026814 [Portunus trituberculatus]|uniref:Uncharacterized protein n=1 Tax=Portunus trituberculatus TaxID=210409 RepID=A0A5B7EK96_PORTR|nr:hypothetical protein [Portunus trituberculatus]